MEHMCFAREDWLFTGNKETKKLFNFIQNAHFAAFFTWNNLLQKLHKIRERKVKTLTINWRDHHRTGTLKLNRNISMDTVVFLNQKRVNVCEQTTKMVSLLIPVGMYVYSITYPLIFITSPNGILNSLSIRSVL